jgi:NhaP-type Na+/H+ or K+/H+ antiporter
VESGLNDGIALPALLFAISLAAGTSAEVGGHETHWVSFVLQ